MIVAVLSCVLLIMVFCYNDMVVIMIMVMVSDCVDLFSHRHWWWLTRMTLIYTACCWNNHTLLSSWHFCCM